MDGIGEVRHRLRKDRVARNKPHHKARLPDRHVVEDVLQRTGRDKRLAAARGDLDANVRRTRNVVMVALRRQKPLG